MTYGDLNRSSCRKYGVPQKEKPTDRNPWAFNC
jgi:hypothetical protein